MIQKFLARRRRIKAALKAFDGVPVDMIESAGGFAVTYDVPIDGGPDVREEYYEVFRSPDEAFAMFGTAFPPGPFAKEFLTDEITNPKLCLILQPIAGYRSLEEIVADSLS